MRTILGPVVIGVVVLGSPGRPVVGQQDEPQLEPAGEKLSERDQRILDLFVASRKSFTKDGRLRLEYDFETKQQDLVEDWKPDLKPQVQRIRWSRGAEGTPSTVEDGIVIGDYGEWFHEAVFLTDGLEVTVDQMNLSPFKPGSIQAVVLYNEKKKMSLGVNAGAQAVVLKGWKHAKNPIPRNERPVTSCQRFKAGLRMKATTLECVLEGRKLSDTAQNVKFTDGFDRGRVGLAWSGSIQCWIFNVVMEGRLDPEWTAKALGEVVDSKAEKKKAGPKEKAQPKEKVAKKTAPAAKP
jgi:hypothetical protein